ncbi:hypothetical protein Arnit_1374 [Arcobacter nitrofigilis DSM 7299]|uniref:Uncharacterized protein n=1 Tax=Arcobacter nitrofigilis (strain ATCC 33309 / DSM 7299 / CCUG 15893 / LMG 7604 / NCTC 12251 / CI) TaxID=572480 RepID=D5V597_ARCNC|nr:hypothetical protein [Arcobacter nitrofigilis]ADG93032.1 hypothetical protein Arnit_1374 [Arcobacter nitrofigilis DSM 7299]
MDNRLHEIMAQCAIIHETNIKTNIIDDLDKIEENLSNGDSDVKEHYLTLLMQYYFQKNKLEQLKQLLLEGYKFDMRFIDIVEAFCHLKDDEDNVIEFFEDNVVMLKDSITDNDLKKMYEYYQSNLEYKNFIDEPLNLIKKNRYVCAQAYKSKEEFAKFFLNEDLLESLKRDMPFILK